MMRDITMKALQMALDAGASGARVFLEKGNGDMVTILNGEIDVSIKLPVQLSFPHLYRRQIRLFFTNLLDD